MRNPPILISITGFFAILAGVDALFLGTRLLGFNWFGVFGDLPGVEHAGLWGWLALGVGVLWIVISFGLWTMQSWAWLATIVLCGLNLFWSFLLMLELPGSGAGIATAFVPTIVVLYMLTSSVRDEFGLTKAPR